MDSVELEPGWLNRELAKCHREARQHRIFDELILERERQDARFGYDRVNAPWLWSLVLAEEAGEVARAVLEGGSSLPTAEWTDQRIADLKGELIQVAAVSVAWLEQLDREEKARGK